MEAPVIDPQKFPLLSKLAASAANNYLGIAHQSYLPVNERRDLNPDEEARIAARQRKLIPKIFTSLRDNPEVDMSTPWLPAILMGLLGTGAGAFGGAALGRMFGGDDSDIGPAIGSALGAVGGGLGLGAVGYKSRQAHNADIEEMMRRLPPGATRRDIMSDPAWQASQQRAHERSLAGQQTTRGLGGLGAMLYGMSQYS